MTNLPNLDDVAFDELRHTHKEQLTPFWNDMLKQVERPRVNLGSGPPGRAD